MSARVEALDDIKLGRPFRVLWLFSMNCSLIEESVAQRKTPMLDLVPMHANSVLDRYSGDHPVAMVTSD